MQLITLCEKNVQNYENTPKNEKYTVESCHIAPATKVPGGLCRICDYPKPPLDMQLSKNQDLEVSLSKRTPVQMGPDSPAP